MSEMKQYLYEYRNNRPVRNLGLLKINKRPEKLVLQIYSREMDEVKGIVLQSPDGNRYIVGWAPDFIDIDQEMPFDAEEFVVPRNVIFEKIQRQDLSRLPRKDWRLANNSFLLHGFYNYNHLLYIEEEGEVWIGVPGIYHEKEKQAAKVFGFTNFRHVSDVNVELEENEKNNYEDFGYWCRQILNPNL